MKLLKDETAVSISIGFILTFVISVVALVTVLTAFYTLMDKAEQTVMRSEFEIHGNDISMHISSIDTLVAVMNNSGAYIDLMEYDLNLPDKIAGEHYSVSIVDSSHEIVLQSRDKEETKVMIPYSAQNMRVIESTVFSEAGTHYMAYGPINRTLEIR
ncbi:hypothetical protein Metho_0062 [Methanomethylovorans hollandica DSM 15978]|uniref:Uncharacterized protein n=1 Tax=Methanomethylovorans hollandica (strain DSM 15978 / NBRC 107637 / DMS1) TaxID=867904 RepID=L0KWM2_METHD|nr:hypothetical protein [Methanomethylovorans hollandica]AGB48359.1 hypothetical protein Metho_0062 [Methanomethylovorans hollandica DSM 15978]